MAFNDLSPETSAYLRRLANDNERLQAQQQALIDRYKALRTEHEGDRMELQRLTQAVKKAAARLRYVEDIPGKRVPYVMNFQINIPGPTDPTISIRGTRLPDTQQVSMDGPFVCTTWLGAFLLKTYSLGPYSGDGTGRPSDAIAGAEVITPLTGRFRPIASTADPFAGAYIGYGLGPQTIAGAQAVQTFRPGLVDFLFEVHDVGSDRARQNQIASPSRYLFSEFDRPLYLPVADFFERGSTVTFAATMLHDIGLAEVNWATTPQGFSEGSLSPAPDPTVTTPTAEIGRVVVGLGGTLYFTMLGYKILQAQSPAV